MAPFLSRDAICISAAFAVMRCPSVRPSVTFVNSVKTSNPQTFCQTIPVLVFVHQTLWLCSDGDPLTGALNAGGVRKNRDYRPISGYRSGVGVKTTTVTVDGAVYRTDRHASVNLLYHNQHGRPRQREENNILNCTQR